MIKVLLIAEAANPNLVSVAHIGWRVAEALGERCEVVLATELRNKESIEKEKLPKGLTVEYVDNRFWQGMAWRISMFLTGKSGLGWTFFAVLCGFAYRFFEKRLWKQFRERIAARKFDVVHRLTPLSPTVGSWLARRCKKLGVPFVVGPLNGGVPWPKEYDDLRRQEREWLSYVRGAYKWLPAVKSMYRNASAILVASRHTQGEVAEMVGACDKLIYLPENGVREFFLECGRGKQEGKLPLKIVFVGRLVPYKAVDMALEALIPYLKHQQCTFEIVGAGPVEAKLKQMVSDAGVQGSVIFSGWQELPGVREALCHADVLLFPSIREFGGGVVVEAMAVGAVPIVVDYAGPGELVCRGRGLKVPVQGREDIIYSLRRVLGEVLEAPEVLEPMRDAGRAYVKEYFTWAAEAQQLEEVYRWLLGEREEKPKFGY